MSKSFITLILAILAVVAAPVASARAVTAQQGTVIAVAETTQAQRPSRNQYRSDDRPVRAIVGGVLGTAAGVLLTRNVRNSSGRYAAMGGLAAIGASVGHAADRRAQHRRPAEPTGFQVVLRLDSGKTVGVFTRADTHVQPGQKVWLIGDSEIIPAE